MKTFRLMLAAIVVTGQAAPAPGEERGLGSRLTENDELWALVEAEVTEVVVPGKPADGGKATIKVTRRYTGPKELIGMTFAQDTASADIWSTADLSDVAIPLLKKGEKALWVLFVAEADSRWHVSNNFRRVNSPHYDWVLEWADQVERLAKIKPVARMKEAMVLCGNKNPEVARLGIEVLFGAYEPYGGRAGVFAFLAGLPFNPAVSHAVLPSADGHFLARDRDKWMASPARKALLARFTEVMTEADGAGIVDYIGHSGGNRPALSRAEAAALLGNIAANSRQALPVRMMALEALVKEVQLSAEYDPAFDVLAETFKLEPDEKLRLYIAQGLAKLPRQYSTPFPPAQSDVLRELVKKETNADVKKALQSAIDKAK